MNTATVLVIAALVIVAAAERDWCKDCQADMVDIRGKVGNNGMGASLLQILNALYIACNTRFADIFDQCYYQNVPAIPTVKAELDAGKTDKEICIAAGYCA
uniref:Saposin B-type domain-containing protein n=1 Tax=Panagrellus redivivus TaxID=6233 RepID=A0A7E4UY61_PANRE